MNWRIGPATVNGDVRVPGDKSIAHRALMLGALGAGVTMIDGLPDGADVQSTATCLETLGTPITRNGDRVTVTGGSLQPPEVDLDAGNSGTTTRLLTGILSGQTFPSRLTGDASLQTRPMRRVIDPLTEMGARIGSHDGKLPLDIDGTRLRGMAYTLPVASAQVKSAILLAGLFAQSATTVIQPIATRDHTERMLLAAGADLRVRENEITLQPGARLEALNLRIPGDISSAAFLFVAALLTNGEIQVPDLGVNPTRTGILSVMRRMGGEIDLAGERLEAGEPVATVRAYGAIRYPVEITAPEVPGLIDELPLVALLATQASGVSRVTGAQELRVKETDRIRAVVEGLARLGADISELPDGFEVRGPVDLRGATVDSHGDHRLAMMLAVAGLVARGETIITGAEAAGISFPGFPHVLRRLGAQLEAA